MKTPSPNSPAFSISGTVVDIHNRRMYPGTVTVKDGVISSIRQEENSKSSGYILPGFIDAHVHIESSMLTPAEFARLAVPHGTVATVSDPHEIGNVLGIEGVRYMVRNGQKVPFHFYFGAPSCVPATSFETSGATISAKDIRTLFLSDKLRYLSEMMNYPGVLHRDREVMEKIAIAKELGLPVDGHSPGLKGQEAANYISAGISTDHECYTLDEALDKVKCGMKILIREGSAAKNYQALHPLIGSHPEMVMFCSDDKHPDDLALGHINQLVKRSIVNHGYDTMDVLRAASLNPAIHYNLDVGLLRTGDPADFIVVSNLSDFTVKKTYINGQLTAENGKTLISSSASDCPNHFNTQLKSPEDFAMPAGKGEYLQVIGALEGQLITEKLLKKPKIIDGRAVSDTDRDILKLAVVNRYKDAPVAVGFIHGFGLKRGAIASCIAHDSHNIIAVGVSDEALTQAVNAIIENKGGISVADGKADVLPLPVAGIMSPKDGYEVAKSYARLSMKAKELGTPLNAPFMTLSFMALLVIPTLKLSDKGLFDGQAFTFTPLFLTGEKAHASRS